MTRSLGRSDGASGLISLLDKMSISPHLMTLAAATSRLSK